MAVAAPDSDGDARVNLSRPPPELPVMTRLAPAGRPPTRWRPRTVLAVLAALLAIAMTVPLTPTAPAFGHAALLTATPAPGSVIGSSPTEVLVTFSEPVTLLTGKVRVLDPDGKRISDSPTVRGNALHIPVRRADRPLGTYLVSYRVLSADSHPVAGGLTFSVGAASAKAPELADDSPHPSVAIALSVTRYVGYAGLVLALGPTLLLALLWPRRLSRRGPIRMVRTGLGCVMAATVSALWLQAPYSSGGALSDVSAADLGEVLASSLGGVLVARLAVLTIVAALLTPVLRGRADRRRAAVLTALTVGGLTTWPLAGHAAAAPLSAVVVAAGVVHIAAMAAWLGGLVTLAAFLLRGAHPRVLGVILPAWSRLAAIFVVWLVGSGVVQAVVQVGSLPSLLNTPYGRLLLGKSAILGVVLGVAAYARWLVQRATVRPSPTGPAGTATTAPAGNPTRLRRTVAVELAASTVVLALSAVLVQVDPARSATAPQAVDSVAGVSQTLTAALYTLQFNIYPVQLGENNTVHAFVYTPQGEPLTAREWSVATLLVGHDTEAVTTPMLGVLPHHAIGSVSFPVRGVYEIQFTVRTSPIDRATVRTTVTVR